MATPHLCSRWRVAGRRARHPSMPSRSGCCFDFDLHLLLLRMLRLREGNCQHALREVGGDLVTIDTLRQCEGALERAVGTLGHIAILFLLLLLVALLAFERQ